MGHITDAEDTHVPLLSMPQGLRLCRVTCCLCKKRDVFGPRISLVWHPACLLLQVRDMWRHSHQNSSIRCVRGPSISCSISRAQSRLRVLPCSVMGSLLRAPHTMQSTKRICGTNVLSLLAPESWLAHETADVHLGLLFSAYCVLLLFAPLCICRRSCHGCC